MKCQFILLVCCLAWTTYGQESTSKCHSQDDCGSCLRAGGSCAFCKDEDYTAGVNKQRARCFDISNLTETKCKDYMNIPNRKTSSTEQFTSTLQVIPKKVTLTLRPGRAQKFKLKIKPAKDFPVDIYYLMDMSRSMYDDLEKLRSLGTEIAKEISSITKNYKLAFGSFVDKTVEPFIQSNKLDQPCTYEDENNKTWPCAKTFGYKHIFDFNKDASLFEDALKKEKISGNLDTPEGGFDGLMQVVSCQAVLKWQSVDKARRIVVYVTDASPHIGGDGRIGGILTPNDGQCHAKKVNNFYEHSESTKQDYPSISWLKQKLDEQSIIPIMAVTSNVQNVYKKIVNDWSNAAIGTLEDDSRNIVDLIAEKYREIVRTLKPTDDKPENLTIKYQATNCAEPSSDGGQCKNVVEGQEYGFDVSVTALVCPDKSKWGEKKSFTITVVGYGKVEVEYSMICECDCESKGTRDPAKCNNNGNFTCGICYCDEGRFGNLCECDETAQADDSMCKDEQGIVCSGQGRCYCGKCVCDKREKAGETTSGKFCECNNYSCDRYEGKLCGGPSRGKCECGQCKCLEAYLGDNCSQDNCTLISADCKINGEICSNNGRCNCNQCVCKPGYDGVHCEKCVSCPGQCSKHKDCVQCLVWQEGAMYDKETNPNCRDCVDLNIVPVNETVDTCRYQNDSGCWFQFSFNKANENFTIFVQREKECVIVYKSATPILAIVLGIIGGLILLALILLLLWKLLITAYDNYEYQKFMKDNQNPNWANTNNPIYKPSQTNYQNPTYAGK